MTHMVPIVYACLLGMPVNAQPPTGEYPSAEGMRLCQQSQYAQAEPLVNRAEAVREETRGSNRPVVREVNVVQAGTPIGDVHRVLGPPLEIVYRDAGLGRKQETCHLYMIAGDQFKIYLSQAGDAVDHMHSLSHVDDRGNYAWRVVKTVTRDSEGIGIEWSDLPAVRDNWPLKASAQMHTVAAFEPAMQVHGSVPQHPDVTVMANAEAAWRELNEQVQRLYRQGRYAEAKATAENALCVAENSLGTNHVCTASALDNLAELCRIQSQYAQAEPLYQRALAIREEAYGPSNTAVIPILDHLATLYQDQGQFAKAEPLYQRVLAFYEKAGRPEHPVVAAILNKLAQTYEAQGRSADAKPLLRRAEAIQAKVRSPGHANAALTANAQRPTWEDLDAQVQRLCQQRRYAEGIVVGKKALRVAEDTFGTNHVNTATALNRLAVLFDYEGQYALAEPFYQHVLEIRTKILGTEHPDVAATMSSLGRMYYALGQYLKAARLWRSALAIRDKVLGSDTPAVAESLNDLAQLYEAQGQYARAEQLYKRALAIDEKAYGPAHPAVARDLNNMAALYTAQAVYAQADAFYKRSLAIIEKVLGPDHPLAVVTLNNLAGLHHAEGHYAEAEPYCQRSLAIAVKVFGQDHPDVGRVLNDFALLKAADGQNVEALALMMQENAIRDRLIEQVISFSSENDRFLFLGTLQRKHCGFLSLCAERLAAKGGGRAALDYLLRRKGVVLESLLADAEAARLSGNPELKGLVEELTETKNRLAALVMGGLGKDTPETYQSKVKALRGEAEALEKELARGSARFRVGRDLFRVGLTNVVAALPLGRALVEFAKYRSFDFNATGTNSPWGKERYVAYVLQGGERKLLLVKLGEADGIETRVRAYRSGLQGFVQGRATIADVNAASEALEQAVWAPVRKALCQAKRVYLSPDGELNFVSFAGLRDKTGRYVMEDYDLSYVSSGRDLVRGKLQADSAQRRSVLFGAPDFGGATMDPGMEMLPRGGVFRSELANVRAFENMTFPPLTNTMVEVRAIDVLLAGKGLKPETHLGFAATEGRVKATEQPRILHLATHGFFLPESGWGEQPKDRGLLGWRRGETGFGDQPVDLGKWRLENPMHRSGLALAGANLTLAGKVNLGEEDGILTAEEVAGLDLAGTKLVVLSACETGLGEAKGGEGVLGLRRAFVRAGAENLVMALWQVADEATCKLMVTMYAKYVDGQPVWKALLTAQREALAAERTAGREPNPYLWAAFVSSGVGME